MVIRVENVVEQVFVPSCFVVQLADAVGPSDPLLVRCSRERKMGWPMYERRVEPEGEIEGRMKPI